MVSKISFCFLFLSLNSGICGVEEHSVCFVLFNFVFFWSKSPMQKSAWALKACYVALPDSAPFPH